MPLELDQQLWSAVDDFEEEKTVRYVSSLERIVMERGMQKGLEQGLERGLERGLEKGLEKGLEQGLRDGVATTLRRQLARRFGPLPEWVLAKLARASQEDLEGWADRILEATSLEAVFEPWH